jgi:hypothetical protein
MVLEARRQQCLDDMRDRDLLVLEGCDSGRPAREVAGAALVSQARVNQLIAKIG